MGDTEHEDDTFTPAEYDSHNMLEPEPGYPVDYYPHQAPPPGFVQFRQEDIDLLMNSPQKNDANKVALILGGIIFVILALGMALTIWFILWLTSLVPGAESTSESGTEALTTAMILVDNYR